MRRRLHPLIALLCALFLLGAQQAAYAHFLGHLGAAVETAASGDDEHGAATTLSHVCTTCAAFSAFGGAAPAADAPTIGLAEGAARVLPLRAAASFATRAGPPSGARAPPSVL